MKINDGITLEQFAKRFLAGGMHWRDVPRLAITNFGSIVSFVIFRESPFQVELFIVPSAPSSFPVHCHPNVDAIEFPLSGNSWLQVNGEDVWTQEQIEQWLDYRLPSRPVPIAHDDMHCGGGSTPYAFLSIQKWLNGVQPSSVGLDWEGETSSVAHAMMWQRYMVAGSV